MKLDEFVTETLEEIANGVINAQDRLKNIQGVYVNPYDFHQEPGTDFAVYRRDNLLIETAMVINFDVAVTVNESGTDSDTTTKGASGGIQVLSFFNAQAKADVSNEQATTRTNETVSRLSFAVQMKLPVPENQGHRSTKLHDGPPQSETSK